jgi:lysophospholipase L1-like esterase
MRVIQTRPTAIVLLIAFLLAHGACATHEPQPAVAPPLPPPQPSTLPVASTLPVPSTSPVPFEKDIRAFEAADAKEAPAPGGVLFVGSSSIRLWTTLAEDFPGVPVINRGFGGSKIAHSTLHADRIVTPYKPSTIFLYAGDNDIAGGLTAEQVFADYKAFVAKVRETLPDTRIYFIAIKPSTLRWKLVDTIREANRLVKEYSESEKNLGYVDVFTPMLGADGMPRPELLRKDGLHMTRAGYEIWRDAIKPLLDTTTP